MSKKKKANEKKLKKKKKPKECRECFWCLGYHKTLKRSVVHSVLGIVIVRRVLWIRNDTLSFPQFGGWLYIGSGRKGLSSRSTRVIKECNFMSARRQVDAAAASSRWQSWPLLRCRVRIMCSFSECPRNVLYMARVCVKKKKEGKKNYYVEPGLCWLKPQLISHFKRWIATKAETKIKKRIHLRRQSRSCPRLSDGFMSEKVCTTVLVLSPWTPKE